MRELAPKAFVRPELTPTEESHDRYLRHIVRQWNDELEQDGRDCHYVVRNLRIWKRRGKREQICNANWCKDNDGHKFKFDIFD
jgi:hypothetical protein